MWLNSLWPQCVFAVVGGHVFAPSIRQMLTSPLTHLRLLINVLITGCLTFEASQRSQQNVFCGVQSLCLCVSKYSVESYYYYYCF